MIRLGLTGGIGSGKSTASSALQKMGAQLIDADALSRATTAPGGAAIDSIRRHFGAEYIASDGALDRDRMRQLVFSNPAARAALEAIIHPLVGAETRRLLIDADSPVAVLDIPLLVESGRWRQQLDRVLVIDCEVETQVARTTARSGLIEQAVRAIIAQQAPRPLRLSCADDVIYNDGITPQQLTQQVRELGQRFGL